MNHEYPIKKPNGRRLSLAEEVAGKLIEKIRQGEWETETQIPNEFELAEQFGVGRGSVREAVKTLVSRNILEIRPAKGTFVCKNPGVSDDPFGLELLQNQEQILCDLQEVRLLLECYAVRMAAAHATGDQIVRMREIADKFDEKDITDEQRAAYDIELHQYIAEICGNVAVPVILSTLRAYIGPPYVENTWHGTNYGHREIITAIEQRNPMLAEVAVIKHLSY